MKRALFLAAIFALATACEEEPPEPTDTEEVAQPQLKKETAPKPAEEPQLDVKSIATISRATYEMSLWADAPDSIDPGPDTVVLKYENFPGHYERFDGDLVKDCVLANEKKPFRMTVYRYQFADEKSFERVVALDACPQLDEEELAREWVEAERLRQGVEEPAAADPKTNKLGWAGRGFIKIEGASEAQGPQTAEGWQTFCGASTNVECEAALRTGTADRQP